MKHKCTACGKIYEEGANEILNGCACGSKLFYFVKKDEKQKPISQDVSYFYEVEDDENEEIIVFDLEAINIKGQGKYEIDLNTLMNANDHGLVYKYGEGKYSIDIEQDFSKIRQKR